MQERGKKIICIKLQQCILHDVESVGNTRSWPFCHARLYEQVYQLSCLRQLKHLLSKSQVIWLF